MHLSMNIFNERLTKWNPVMIAKQNSRKMAFIGLQLISQDLELLPQHILFGYAEDFNHHSSFMNKGIICIGTPDQSIIDRNLCICLSDSDDLYEVYSEIQKIFMKFNLWNDELTKSVLDDISLEKICTLSIPVFENPILIHDENSEVLVSVNEMPGQVVCNYDIATGKRSLPIDIMNDFKVSEEYQNTLNTTGAHMFSEQQAGYRILYINLWYENSYLGRICVNELGRSILVGDFQLIEHLANIVLTSLRRGNMYISDKSPDLKQSFIEILEFNNTNEDVLTNRLAAFGWKIDDNYLCVRILLSERDYTTHAINYTCNQLRNMFPFFYTFLYKDCILIIVKPDNSNITKDEFFSKLAIFLREGLFKASISSLGHNFRFLSYYYKQTIAGFKIGSHENPMLWIYKFNDYILQYCLEQATSELTPIMLCEPNLLELYKYDQKHQTTFFETLRTYLSKERNIAHTATALFVHRSTLLYRLNKLETLLKLDLNKPEVRLHLLLSYEFFDLASKKIEQ